MTGPARLVAALFGVIVVVAAVVFFTREDDSYTAKVEMPNAYGVRKNSSVKIAGANGGKVQQVNIDRQGDRDIAVLTLKFKDEAKPIGKDTKITVRPTDLLGERYIALEPGNFEGDPLEDGGTIGVSAVSAPVELDNILNLFTDDVRAQMAVLVNEFGVALDGRGNDFNKLIRELPPSLGDARKLTQQIAAENDALDELVTRGDTLLTKFNTKKGDFKQLITNADQALNLVADNRRNLGATLRSAPAALGQLTSTLNSVDRASDSLGPAADSLRRAAAPLASTMRELPDFQEAAEGTLKAATSAAPEITRLGRGTTNPVKAVRKTAGDATNILTDAQPIIDTIGRRADKDILWMLQQLSRWTRPKDSLTHQVPANILVDENYLVQALENIGSFDGGGATTSRSRKDPAPKPEERTTQEAPAVPTAAPKASPAPEAPKLELPEIRLPELPILKDLPETLKETTQALQKTTQDLTDALPNLGKGIQETVGNLTQKLGLSGQQQENSDAMGLFDYLFAP